MVVSVALAAGAEENAERDEDELRPVAEALQAVQPCALKGPCEGVGHDSAHGGEQGLEVHIYKNSIKKIEQQLLLHIDYLQFEMQIE